MELKIQRMVIELLHFVLFTIYISLILMVIFVERKRPTEAILWVVIMIFLPYFGTILYLIFGSTVAIKLTAIIRKKKLNTQAYNIELLPAVSVEKGQLSEADQQVVRFNHVYNASKLTCYDKADFYTDGKSHYTQLFHDILEAKQCIFIEFYTIHHDIVGENLVKVLTEKAKEGVEVWVMCDFIANLSTPKKMFQPLVDAGGKVVRVKPYFTHYRSHRKIVSIDQRIAYIGGMNIGKQYANMDKKKNPWRDTQIRLEGACTSILNTYFLNDWLCSIRRREWKHAISYMNQMEHVNYGKTSELCQFIAGGVDTNKEAVKMCYMSLIRSAKHRIRIQSPYFIPDASILDALKTAAASGVEIELMIPGIKASFFLDPVTNYYSGQLLEYGTKVYKYKGYIHAKTMIIDDELCCVGSVNMDMRSLMVDDEVCGVFYENQLVQKYNQIYDKDITDCTPYTWEAFQNRDRKERLMESIFLPFAPLM